MIVSRATRFTSLAVTNDQLTLTTTNRNHRINRFGTGLQRLAKPIDVQSRPAIFSIGLVAVALIGPLPSIG